MIDTHAHIYLEHFESDLPEVIERAKQAGISYILMPDIDSSSTSSMIEVREKYPEICRSMAGLHPTSVNNDFKEELDHVYKELSTGKHIAVGEIGTDLYWDKTWWQQQQEALKTQLLWAVEFDLPAVIHCRESLDETLEIIEELGEEKLKGVFHCFSGTLAQAKRVVDNNFLLGIGGVATFKNGGLEPVLREISLQKMVLETDSPYLAPVPFRGKRNEPAYTRLVAEKIATSKGVELDEVLSVTDSNARKLFKL